MSDKHLKAAGEALVANEVKKKLLKLAEGLQEQAEEIANVVCNNEPHLSHLGYQSANLILGWLEQAKNDITDSLANIPEPSEGE